MGQVTARVILRNARDVVMAQLGHLADEQVHTYEAEALIDTGATRATLPPFVADQLGLVRLRGTEAQYADGRVEEVDTTEPFMIEIMGRQTGQVAMVLGTQILIGGDGVRRTGPVGRLPPAAAAPQPGASRSAGVPGLGHDGHDDMPHARRTPPVQSRRWPRSIRLSASCISSKS